MPELPEVETMLRGIAGAMGGRIRGIQWMRLKARPIQICPALPAFRRRVQGRTIIGARRLGKRVVLELDSAERIIFEPRMTGLILPGDPPDRSHLRFVIRLEGSGLAQIMFWDQRGLGMVRLVSPAEFEQRCGPGRLGPDALEIALPELRTRLRASGRPIKVALIDQRVLAGIGNLYASEILHLARIDPRRKCHELNAPQWRRLHSAMQEVLAEAIRHEGSTLTDGTYRVGRERMGTYQDQHRVYQRAGQPCIRCAKGQIVRIVQAQRSTFFCSCCQR